MPQRPRNIALINQKGGVGKTTTTANLAAALARAGRDSGFSKKVLVIDLDPQSHLTMHLGVDPAADGLPTIYNVLTDGTPLAEAIRPTSVENVRIIPATIDLAAAEIELVGVVGREVLLRDALAGLGDENRYDYLLLDCPPSLGLLTLNALAAAQEVIICLQPHFLGLQGVGKLLETVGLVQQRINPGLSVSGVVLCMYEMGTRLAGEVTDDLAGFLAEARAARTAGKQTPWSSARIFKTCIRRNIKLAESPSFGQVIFQYAPASHGAADYANLADEVLAMESAPQSDESAGPGESAAIGESAGSIGELARREYTAGKPPVYSPGANSAPAQEPAPAPSPADPPGASQPIQPPDDPAPQLEPASAQADPLPPPPADEPPADESPAV